MAISLQADSTLPQGYILVDGQRAATISTTGLSATLADGLVTTSALASGAVTTEKITGGSVTAAKMSGSQSGDAPIYGCRAWVNFSGIDALYHAGENLANTVTITVTAGNNFGFWTNSAGTYTTSTSYLLGVRYWLPVLNGVAGGLLGGADVSSSTNAIQFTEIISSTRLKFRFTNNQIPLTDASVTGNNTTNFRFQTYGIRESGNVASVVRNGTGLYIINFITPMPDAYGAVNVEASFGTPTSDQVDFKEAFIVSPSAVQVSLFNASAFQDASRVYVTLLR
jgi:hypothetical protein